MIEIKSEVVPAMCRREGEAMVVTVKAFTTDGSYAHATLNDEEAKAAAVSYAAMNGVSVPRMEDSPMIYPVDKDDKPIEDPAKQKLAAYVAEYRVAPRLV